ncbi:hypothetical protein CA984_40880 [Streptosporangium minutum]|uniref:Uncharacterized protein n=1 Tax=Streptosporangium minutum TaxID=569862 RepID=A0A243QMG8_9ACTN|nr:hypothetical protein CA984_40880 [Streptosporangium minutum]
MLITRQQCQLAALEQTFPGWHVTHDPVLSRWTAIRHTPLSERERRGGVRYMLTYPSAEALGSALADQVELAHTYGPTRP